MLFENKSFTSHSGINLSWKINCDSITDQEWETIAKIVADKIDFAEVIGVPTGGLKFEKALKKYADRGAWNNILIVDDVLTTGNSMLEAKEKFSIANPDRIYNYYGIVLFSRSPGREPSWVQPIFTFNHEFS